MVYFMNLHKFAQKSCKNSKNMLKLKMKCNIFIWKGEKYGYTERKRRSNQRITKD